MPGMILKNGTSVALLSYFDAEKSRVRLKVRVSSEATEFEVPLLEILEEACSLEAHYSDKKHEVYRAMYLHLRNLTCYFERRSDEFLANFRAEELKGEIL